MAAEAGKDPPWGLTLLLLPARTQHSPCTAELCAPDTAVRWGCGSQPHHHVHPQPRAQTGVPSPGTYHSWSSGEGMSPADSVPEPSTRPCHQLLSSLLMI